MADGFLGRWAKRKEAVRQGKAVPAEPEVGGQAPRPSAPPSASGTASDGAGPVPSAGPEEPAPALPTLEDARSLSADSDFTRFVQPGVDPQVKNAAMKKLFADPHFNVMDGLDTYIDDYSKPDPIPPDMLRSLVSGKFLGLFEEKKDEEEAAADKAPTGREVVDVPARDSVAQSGTRTGPALPPAEDHADPDLRLQQDDAPGPRGPGAGAG